MDYVNADGSLAEMCGNGARVYARYLVAAGWAQPGELLLATRGGVRRVEVPADPAGDIAVDMGPPLVDPAPVDGNHRRRRATRARRCRWATLTWSARSPTRRRSTWSRRPASIPRRFPHGVNVEVYAAHRRALVMRVHERGSGETLSCGTGACAVAVADAASRGEQSADVLVDVPGGRLRVVWEGASVILHGPANIVAAGRWWG